jgi:Domain of unknown function (DUF4203)
MDQLFPTIPLVVAGAILIVLGRRVFWLFVGTVGFAAGIIIASKLFRDQPHAVYLVAGLGAGLLCAIAAIFLQRIAIGLAGFLAGGFGTIALMDIFGFGTVQFPWLPFFVGGILASILVAMLFEWALIVVSSVAGAAAIVYALAMPESIGTVAFIVLAAVGVALQTSQKRRKMKQTT